MGGYVNANGLKFEIVQRWPVNRNEKAEYRLRVLCPCCGKLFYQNCFKDLETALQTAQSLWGGRIVKLEEGN